MNDILIDGSKCEGEVIIPGNVKVIGKNTFYHNDNITKIEIPSSVKKIDENAIIKCENLESIIIPKTVITINDNGIIGINATKLTLYGMKNSAAESYAYKFGVKFSTVPK